MSDYVSRIFGLSPVKPLQNHIAKAVECSEQLIPLFNAVVAENLDEVRRIQERIIELENEADTLKKEIRLHLPNSLFMPVARGDLLGVLRIQDNIANKTKDIAGIVVGRKMKFPPVLAQPLLAFMERALDAARQAEKTVNELDELFETGFRGAEVDLTQSLIHELDRIENETDQMQIEIRGKLFEIEASMSPVEVIFLYKILDLTGDLADTAQRVGSRLQLLLAR